MVTQKVRVLLVVALLSIMMVAGNVLPAGAQTFTPVPIGCWHNGKSYPVGTVLHFYLPEPPTHIWMRCELNLTAFPSGPRTHWVYYSSNPS